MGLFDRFKKVNRELMPLVYYREDAAQGRISDNSSFPKDLAEVMILFCKRLHYMDVFPEDKIVAFDIPAMLSMLAQWDVLHDVEITEFNIAQVAFGDDYVAMWYEDGETTPYTQYLVPEQIVFYHSDKAYNYGFSLISEGLDLCQWTESSTYHESLSQRLGKAQPIKLGVTGIHQLKSAYHILFIYLKYKMLIQAKKQGYYEAIESFGKIFCGVDDKESFVHYANQYFALNLEKREFYPLAFENKSFTRFFLDLILEFKMGLVLEYSSFEDIMKWFNLHHDLAMPKNNFSNRFDLLLHIQRFLHLRNLDLYLLSRNSLLEDSVVLVSKERKREILKGKIEAKLLLFDQGLIDQYSDEIKEEEHIRRICRDLYPLLGASYEGDMEFSILGTEVLDSELYNGSYLLFLDWKEEELTYLLHEFFCAHGLEHLMQETSISRQSLEQACSVDEELSPYDRVLIYAEPLKDEDKLLVYLDTESDGDVFAMIDNTSATKHEFIRLMGELIALGEVSDYKILDEKDLSMEYSVKGRSAYESVKVEFI